MAGRTRTFQPATTGATAGEAVAAPPESVPAAPTPPPPASGPADAGTAGSVDTGAYPGPVRGVPRAAGSDMPEHVRREWRHRLRASAGKLARAYADAAAAEDAWGALAQEAQRAGVPADMLTAALADAGVPAHAHA